MCIDEYLDQSLIFYGIRYKKMLLEQNKYQMKAHRIGRGDGPE